ncbi:MAG: penicillin-binding protein 2 [Ignavibacteriaceae bacterium]|nr:penicillin-binding protein 2 [Ignavibacteriaceae bacterium]
MVNFASISRQRIFIFIISITISLFILRLFQLQIVNFNENAERSSGNSVKAIEQIPLRGVFYDRNMQLLVQNSPAYTIRITPSEYDTTKNNILEAALELDRGTIKSIIYKNRIYSKHIPIRIKRGVDIDAISWIEENQENLDGVDYIIEMQRTYPAGVNGAHLFGYSKEITPSQLKKDSFYVPGDLVGYTGIERTYEKELRGIKGYKYIVVDSKRREVGRFKDGEKDVSSVKGEDLVLGIDAEIQRIAETELVGKSGAVVAIEPESGEVLALASAPAFDLNMFSYRTPREYLELLSRDKLKPQYNRATMSAHPPGSTYKILCALAALDLGVITENTTLYCGGGYTFGRFFKCHGAHGAVNVTHAIEKSCNSFFYQLIFKIGLEKLQEYSNIFFMGRKFGSDFREEVAGLIPNSKYYERFYGENWPRGILVSLGIGQGEISATPMQLAYFTALVANNGKSHQPHLVRGFLDENKKLAIKKTESVYVNISPEALRIVREGMDLVVNGAGTATNVRIPGIRVAGKTGTAQNPHGNDHAWFIGFAPYENPKIAICVLVENSGFGSSNAAPIAKKMIEAYLKPAAEKKKDIPQILATAR